MANQKKRRVISYKLFSANNHPITLQQMLKNVLEDSSKPYYSVVNRFEDLNGDGQTIRVISRFNDFDSSMLLCQMVLFEKDSSHMTLQVTPTARMLELSPVSTKDIDKLHKKKNKNSDEDSTTEFVESILYFGVINNHVVVLGTKSLSPKDLERHLEWLLKILTEQLPDRNCLVALSDKPSANAVRQLKQDSAKSILVGSDVAYTAMALPEENESSNVTPISEVEQIEKTKSVMYQAKTMGAELIDFLKQKGLMTDFTLDDTLDKANLHVNLEFKFKYKTSTSGQKVLDKIATSLRHLDKDDVKIGLVGGGHIKGEDLKLSTDISVVINDKGQIDESDLHAQMLEWLKSKVKTDEVTQDLTEIAAGA